jgi:hypothetical protein
MKGGLYAQKFNEINCYGDNRDLDDKLCAGARNVLFAR